MDVVKKVLIIGSGPIVIGQAAEFDYAGSQACRALKEEGIEVVLVNPNPATIMTDEEMADTIYFEPLTADVLTQVIQKERPDGLLATMGGQVGLNLGVELWKRGVLQREGVRMLGTPAESIHMAEDREEFKRLMERLGERVPRSAIARSVEEALEIGDSLGYPLIVRPAYTLGGTGGGVVTDRSELAEVTGRGLMVSPVHEVLVEESLLGFKEIEYEVMRDSADNCITVCNMENLDPVGIHTGDSVVVAPSQTLTDSEYQMLRAAAIKIIRALGVQGGCNVQFALDPKSPKYYVIEVNPRVSRSSALASKATGYPIARLAAKIALGRRLSEIPNPITGNTWAAFEPSIDYVVVKIPRWPFDKFPGGNRKLGSQMKSTGEAMGLGRSFESALAKAYRSLDSRVSLYDRKAAGVPDFQLELQLSSPDDTRLALIFEALWRNWPVDRISGLTGIDAFFIRGMKHLVEALRRAERAPGDPGVLRECKRLGLADADIAAAWKMEEIQVARLRDEHGIRPVYKCVDTCAAEFEAATPYYYSEYERENEAREPIRSALVIGAGPIRIGQGIEFDYCSVHAAIALRKMGCGAVVANNNPETVSTDFSTSDRLYFEPLTVEDVESVVSQEAPEQVFFQFGGQTAINLVDGMVLRGVSPSGISREAIDITEDRERFEVLGARLGIRLPRSGIARSAREALRVANEIGYPVLIRPSYVLGGRGMEIVRSESEMAAVIEEAVVVSGSHPVLIDQYIEGKEAEVDAVCDGEEVLIPAVMEHIERAGIHSGDSIACVPERSLSPSVVQKIVDYTTKLGRELRIVGLMNIQFVVHGEEVYVLEVNPRSSRTIPFISKLTRVPMVDLAIQASRGRKLRHLGYGLGLYNRLPYWGVKAPVFSWAKLKGVDTTLGPEMKSTGEVMGCHWSFEIALLKAMRAAGFAMERKGGVLATIADRDKAVAVPCLAELNEMGYPIFATRGTAAALRAQGVPVTVVNKISEGRPDVLDVIQGNDVSLVVSTTTHGRQPERDGFKIRRAAVEFGVPSICSVDTLGALVSALKVVRDQELPALAINELWRYAASETDSSSG
ncbi:MAG TPA: carbamoyl-phosphate synthase large subunit [Firmicutes bacterium]|nr:carbamoyl-phosphate synthase large subunit [Bacillota bacterium]